MNILWCLCNHTEAEHDDDGCRACGCTQFEYDPIYEPPEEVAYED